MLPHLKNFCSNCGKDFRKSSASSNSIKGIKTVSNFNYNTSKIVKGIKTFATLLCGIYVAVGVLLFVVGIYNSDAATQDDSLPVFLNFLIISGVVFLNAFINYYVFNWLASVLECLHVISKKK